MAIAIDSTSSGNTSGNQTSLTISHTCSGVDRVLIVAARTLPASRVTGITYNGVSMSLIASTNNGSGDRTVYLYYLIAPATGTNNIVASYSGSTNGSLVSASYTGVKQTGFPDSQVTATQSTGTSRTITTTVVASGCWLTGTSENTLNTTVAGSGTVIRAVNAGTTNFPIIDSNGTVGTGSQSLVVSFSGSNAPNVGIVVSMAPVPTTIKTWDGVANANIKTLMGVTKANVKTINGIT